MSGRGGCVTWCRVAIAAGMKGRSSWAGGSCSASPQGSAVKCTSAMQSSESLQNVGKELWWAVDAAQLMVEGLRWEDDCGKLDDGQWTLCAGGPTVATEWHM